MSNHLLSVTKTKYGIGHIPIVQSVLAHCFILQTPYLLPENYFIHHRPTVMNQFNHTSELLKNPKVKRKNEKDATEERRMRNGRKHG